MAGKGRPRELRFLNFVDIRDSDECWPWVGGKYYNGYGQFFRNPEKTTAHRFSYEMFVGEVPRHLDVCHKCDNRICVNPAHLFLGTKSDNIRDMVAKGRQVITDRRGECNGRAIITEKDVLEMRTYFKKGHTIASIARLFKVSETQTARIIKNQSWRHIANE